MNVNKGISNNKWCGRIEENNIKREIVEGLKLNYDEIDLGTEGNQKLIEKLYNEKVQEICNNYTDYQKMKIEYLNSIYVDDEIGTKTKNDYWSLYVNNIHYIEEFKKKDLIEFSGREISDLMGMLVTDSVATKSNIWTFINQYCLWCINRGVKDRNGRVIYENPCDGLDRADMVRVNPKLLMNKYRTVKDIDIILKSIIEHIDYQFAMVIILARYGILGKECSYMINLKIEDVDIDNKNVYIYNEWGDLETIFPIDDIFIEYFKKSIACKRVPVVNSSNWKELEASEYVLKRNDKYVMNTSKIKQILRYVINMVSENKKNFSEEDQKRYNLDRFSAKDLERCRKFDLIDQMRDIIGDEMQFQNYIDITRVFQPDCSESTYVKLMNEYATVKGLDKIKVKRKQRTDLRLDKDGFVYVPPKKRIPGDNRVRIPVEQWEAYKAKRRLLKMEQHKMKIIK